MPDTLIGYLHPNDIAASFHQSLVGLLAWDLSHDGRIGPWANVRSAAGGIPEARNQVVSQLLAERDVDWLFFIDADMGFRPDVLDRLHAVADPVDRPIVGGLCFANREETSDGLGGFRCQARPTLYEWVEHPDGHRRFTGRRDYPVNTLVRTGATGAACVLIHRSVFERIHTEVGPVWFDRVRGTDGSLLGEDISFFVRCQALEVPVHVHTGVRTNHQKQRWISDADFWSEFRPEPAEHPVDVIVPVLHRPQNVAPLMRSLRASTGLATAWFVVEEGDTVETAAVLDAGGQVLEHSGTFAEKVNHAYRHTMAPHLMLVGDDVRFRPGWLDHCEHFVRRYGAQVVGTNDLGNPRVMAGEHATHMLIARSYVAQHGASWDGPGVVCHEGYRHWYVDDEIVTAAKQRGVWQMALGAVVEHLHPIWGKADHDDVYELGQAEAAKDKQTFEFRRRRHLDQVAA